jgi:hypothetical protein
MIYCRKLVQAYMLVGTYQKKSQMLQTAPARMRTSLLGKEEQTNSTSYQALSGHFFRKNLYTYKMLRNKVVPSMVLSSGYVCYSTKVEFPNFILSSTRENGIPYFLHTRGTIHHWQTGVHISAFNKVLLQLKLHKACDFFSTSFTNYQV